MFLQIKYQPNIHQWQWYDMRSEDCNFHRNQTFGRKIYHLFVYFWTSKIVQFDSCWTKSLSVQFECNERGLVCNEACPKSSRM